ncbi:UNVERIFIED_CONTAM: hypothetical protein Slati_2470700 [Sesamum latifolium]|uniref:Reverse transcriptase zinc-binding domain-containing protein n=1 Tax=Sesamum latifolium TaxID=2727402 RepID=A0AAW2WHH0_9LAMI
MAETHSSHISLNLPVFASDNYPLDKELAVATFFLSLLSCGNYLPEGFIPLCIVGCPFWPPVWFLADCKPLALLKIDSRIKGWDGIVLSFAGRVQLVKSVLVSLQVCQPIEEGGLGIKDLLALNRGLMSRHLWELILGDRSSLWVDWIMHYRLRQYSVWTVGDRSGSWGWRKLIRLRGVIRPFIEYRIGSGTSFLLWHDPWHEMGPLLTRFPLGPRHTSTLPMALLSRVIVEGVWRWPQRRVSLLLGAFKIPRHRFILWLAILGKLATLDKPWLHHLGSSCVLCSTDDLESHEHLFFMSFCFECLCIQRLVPYRNWVTAVHCRTLAFCLHLWSIMCGRRGTPESSDAPLGLLSILLGLL